MDYQIAVKANGVGTSWSWVKKVISLTKKEYWMFFMFFIIAFVISMILSAVPFLGLLNIPIGAITAGGYAYCAYKVDCGEDVYIEDLFSGFRRRSWDYLKALAVVSVAVVIALIPTFILVGTFFAIGVNSQESFMAVTEQTVGIVLFIVSALDAILLSLLMIVIMFIYSNAMVVIALYDFSVKESLKLSFEACKKNYLAYIFYSFIWIVILAIAALPLGLGLLALIPTTICYSYVVCREVITLEPSVIIKNQEDGQS